MVLALLAILSIVSAECTREGLLATARTYITAQTSGKLDSLNLGTNFTHREDNKVSDIKRGVLSQSLKIDLNRSTADTVACATYTLLISTTGSKPYILSTQIRHNGNDTDSIAMIDTIAATTGDLFFNAKDTLKYIQAENWGTLEPDKRSSRELLKKVGDAYLDMCKTAQYVDKHS